MPVPSAPPARGGGPGAAGGPDGRGARRHPGRPDRVRPASRAAQAQAEARALAVPTPERARAWLRTLTEEPHVAGTPADRKTALFVRDRLREWGWQADLAEYEVLLNYPVSVRLEVVRPDPQGAQGDGGPPGRRQGLGQPRRLPRLPRLRRLRRRHRAGRLRQLRPARGLRRPGPPGGRGRGPDRPGALRRAVPRPEGPQRPEARRQRGADLLRPGRRRLRQGGRLSPRPVPARLGRPAGSVQFLSLQPGDPSTPHGPSVKGAKRLPFDPVDGFPVAPQSSSIRMGRDAWEKQTGLDRDDYFAAIPSLPIGYEAAGRSSRRWAGPTCRAAGRGDCRWRITSARGRRGPLRRRDGLPDPPDLERDRHAHGPTSPTAGS
jgi:N-acetylated-alpha-linked acidic dipeptidase